MSGTDIFEQLNNALFAQLDELRALDYQHGPKLDKTIEKTEAVADLAERIIQNNNSKISALRFFEGVSNNTDAIAAQQSRLLGDGR